MEALVATLVHRLGFSQLVQFLDADFGCLDGRDELEIALVGGSELFLQSR